MSASRVPLKPMQREAEGHPRGGRYSLTSCESMSWVRPGMHIANACEHTCESFFSLVVATKKMSLKQLKEYKNDLLIITPEEESLGYKHVFQTRLTKETVGDRLRGPMGMWTQQETFIDNNIQFLFDRLHSYYS